jgi:hypothetical protein
MNRRLLAALYLIALTLATGSGAFGQATPNSTTKVAEITTKRLTVNGHAVSSAVVRVDGRFYVSLEDLTSALNGAVTLKGDEIIASFATDQALAPSPQLGNGTIRGTLTYFFNPNRGNLPDAGAEIALVSGRLDTVPSTASVIMLGRELTVIAGKKLEPVKATTADGSGNYSLQDVPPGEYTLLLKSNHSRGATQRDYSGKIRTEILRVEAGKTLDISEDFGVTAF